MRRRIRRWWARHRPRMRTLTRAEAAALLVDRIGEGLATCGTLTIDDDLPTETRRPTMDLEHLIARWRRAASIKRASRATLASAEVYDLCADELEALLRARLQPQEVAHV